MENTPELVKKKIGRPKKQLKDLPGNWKKIVLDEMKEGASIDEITTLLGISYDVYYRLLKEEEDFTETIKRGKQLSKAWWMRQGRLNLFTDPKSFSFTGWYMNMKNRFGWTDKQETNVNINVPTSIMIPQKEKTIRLVPPPMKELAGAGDDGE